MDWQSAGGALLQHTIESHHTQDTSVFRVAATAGLQPVLNEQDLTPTFSQTWLGH